MAQKFTRRSILRAGVGTLVLAPLAPRNILAGERADVIVLGAGLAGLNAAAILTDLGAKVLVLEAQQRVGGRCLTPALSGLEGYGVEFGASQVGSQYARVRETCDRLGLTLGEGAHIVAPYCFSIGGTLVTAEEWPSSPLNRTVGEERRILPTALTGHFFARYTPFASLDQWLEPWAAEHDISVAEWLQRVGASSEVVRLANEGLISPSVHDLSALRPLQEHVRANVQTETDHDTASRDVFERFSQASSHIKGGTQRLPEAMAAALGDGVRLGQQVARIDLSDTGVALTTSDRRRYRCDFVISSLPFTALRRLAISPALTGVQAEAVREMPYSNNTQVFFRLKGEPYWEKDGLPASMWTDGPLSLVRQQIGNNGAREVIEVLGLGYKGDRLDQMDAQTRAAFVARELVRLRPSLADSLELLAVHSWRQTPWINGCSHSYHPGQASRWALEMVKPHQRLHFAGEHTRRLEIGMESAMESGERAALEVLEAAS